MATQNSMEQLKCLSVVVADTGDFMGIEKYKPDDATTNPSLLFQASSLPAYSHLLDDAISYGKQKGMKGEELITIICDKLAVNFGAEILKLVPGVVSTEIDAYASFDKTLMASKARNLIKLYEEVGIYKDRVLIKIAATWEGCQTAKELEAEGIHCNLTLLFSKAQAIAAAEANATLISPFVGRILDWNLKNYPNLQVLTGADDPGVKYVTEIYNYYKSCGYKTIVMGASFRNIEEILALAGCDKLTISPTLLNKLSSVQQPVTRCLDASKAAPMNLPPPLSESEFRWMLNGDIMATEKLTEGINLFDRDLKKLRDLIRSKTHD